VPHAGQNVRSTGSDDENLAGSPVMKLKWRSSTVIQATAGAPEMRLQVWQ
jgi:hypothetical protein